MLQQLFQREKSGIFTPFLINIITLLIASAVKNIKIVLPILVLEFLVINILYMRDKKINIFKHYILLLVFQNVCIGIGSALGNNTGNKDLMFISNMPTLFIVISFLITIVKFRTKIIVVSKFEIFGLLFALTVLISFLITKTNMMSKLGYARNFTLFLIIYYNSKILIENKFDIEEIVDFIIRTTLYVTIFGIIAMLFFNKWIWYNIFGIDGVYTAKGNVLKNMVLPGRWNTILFGFQFKRMVSSYMEPVNLSFLLGGGFLFSYFFNWRKSYQAKVVTLFILVGQILTFGKGGILVSISTICIMYALLNIFDNNLTIKKFMLLLGVMFSVLALIAVFYYLYIGDTAKPHFWGLIHAFKAFIDVPFGHGLGTGGNFYGMFQKVSSKVWISSGSESAIASIIFQLGIQGSLTFLSFFICLSMHEIRSFINAEDENDRKIFALSGALAIGLILSAIFQENTLSPQVISIFMIFIGGSIGYSTNKSY